MRLPSILIFSTVIVGEARAFSTLVTLGRKKLSQRSPGHHRNSMSVSNAAWPPADRLSEYVTEAQLVDYGKLAAQENEWLTPALNLMKTTSPASDADRQALLINAYNLWTIYWVIRERRWPGFKGATGWLSKARFFYWHKIVVSGKKWNLYDFENKLIRPDLNDARVHFALNCASMSCPPLRRQLFTGAGLDAELEEVTAAAVNNGAMVQLQENGNTLRVNPIFKWYKEDFDKEGGVLTFIRRRWTGPTFSEDATVEYFEYDWRTNSVGETWSNRALGGPAP